MLIQIYYKGERGDMGMPEVTRIVTIVSDGRRICITRDDLNPFIITGYDGLQWGINSVDTLNLTTAILGHLFGWPVNLKKQTLAGYLEHRKHRPEIVRLCEWLIRAKPVGFQLTVVKIIDILWPGRWNWRKWYWRTRTRLRINAWLRIVARHGPGALRYHLYNLEKRRAEQCRRHKIEIKCERKPDERHPDIDPKTH